MTWISFIFIFGEVPLESDKDKNTTNTESFLPAKLITLASWVYSCIVFKFKVKAVKMLKSRAIVTRAQETPSSKSC